MQTDLDQYNTRSNREYECVKETQIKVNVDLSKCRLMQLYSIKMLIIQMQNLS